jgi:4'-phosphopantetheinyl transferase
MALGAEPIPPGLLRPLPWHPGLEPSGSPPADPTAPPLLLLLDRRQPIGAELRQRLAASLSCAEQQRLSAYRLVADRERLLLGRGGLRWLLGLWLGLAPEPPGP